MSTIVTFSGLLTGAQFAPKLGAQFTPNYTAHFKPKYYAQFVRNLHFQTFNAQTYQFYLTFTFLL